MNQHTFHVIKDPVHGTMQFTDMEDQWVKPFIDSPNFQRLRHIKQLGMGDYIFPGAVHTRFNHSLGCCYVGSQIAQKIGLSKEERQLVVIACLLHDLGHGPFSHAFEGIFIDKAIRHEAWTPFFLQDYSSDEFFALYNKENPDFPLTQEKFTEIAAMIMHQPIKRRVLADIVSSQLDADRIDYLLRDSHFCGVHYGEFDFRWLLHGLIIVKADTGERLGITYKAIGACEQYLMARRLLTRNISHSKKKLALEGFCVQLFSQLAKSLATEDAFADIRHTRLGKFLLAANEFNEHYDAKNAKNLIIGFLQNQYKHYKSLCDYDVFMLINQLAEMTIDHPVVAIANRLQKRVIPKILEIDFDHLSHAQAILKSFKAQHPQYADWQIQIMKSPHQSYKSEDDPVLVKDQHGDIYPLSRYSIMIDAISDKLEHVAFISVDKPIAEDVPVKALLAELKKHYSYAESYA